MDRLCACCLWRYGGYQPASADKKLFVITAALVSRAVIHGGMDPEDAVSLSDAFIQKCVLLKSMDQIINLQYYMVLEFTGRVERLRFGKKPIQLTIAVTNYIQDRCPSRFGRRKWERRCSCECIHSIQAGNQ